MFAVVEAGGNQHKVTPGQLLKVARMQGNVDDEVRFDKVLMVSSDQTITIGEPTVPGAVVQARIVEQTKGDKLVVFKFKSKKRYRKTRGHRTQLTVLKIEAISQA